MLINHNLISLSTQKHRLFINFFFFFLVATLLLILGSFIGSFARSLVHSFVRSFIRWFGLAQILCLSRKICEIFSFRQKYSDSKFQVMMKGKRETNGDWVLGTCWHALILQIDKIASFLWHFFPLSFFPLFFLFERIFAFIFSQHAMHKFSSFQCDESNRWLENNFNSFEWVLGENWKWWVNFQFGFCTN